MAYDTELADRVRDLIASERGVEEKKMFGGLAFLINGNMSVAVSSKGGLIVRTASEETERLLKGEHVEPMIMAGREEFARGLRGDRRVDRLAGEHAQHQQLEQGHRLVIEPDAGLLCVGGARPIE